MSRIQTEIIDSSIWIGQASFKSVWPLKQGVRGAIDSQEPPVLKLSDSAQGALIPQLRDNDGHGSPSPGFVTGFTL